jgi:signal transduction histidine kinase
MNPSARPTLMVVDDEPEVLRSVHDLLRIEFRVITFTRAVEALAELEHLDVPVVMSDQQMPEMTGVDFLMRVKAMRPDATRLLFTGYSDIRAVIDAINQGSIFRYIAKPWDPDELIGIVRQAVALHDLQVENRRLLAELKQTNAELVEANNLKARFIEVASHELNTPVAIVVGLTELWKLTQADAAEPSQKAWIDRIDGAGKRLAAIVSRMLKLLQASQFDPTLDYASTDVASLVHAVVARIQPFLKARGQEVHVEIAPGVERATFDAAKVDDVITNLLFNAIKFTPDGQTIRVVVTPQGADRLQFQVIDPGMGLSPSDRRHLFQPFFTGMDTMRHSSGEFQFGKRGIGLGLHLVKTFVEIHGGTVEVSSAPERGSTFGFTIPRDPPSASLSRAARARSV